MGFGQRLLDIFLGPPIVSFGERLPRRALRRQAARYLGALHHRLAARRGVKRAMFAVAHNLLVIALHVLSRGVEFEDLGATYFDECANGRPDD